MYTTETEPQSARNTGNPNSLLVPNSRARGDSLDSQTSSKFTAGSNSTAAGPESPEDVVASHRVSDVTQVSRAGSWPPEEEVFEPEGEQEQSLFHVKGDNPFGVTPGHLSKLVGRKNLNAFYYMRGLQGLCKALRTDPKTGLSLTEDDLRGTVRWEDVKSAQVSPPKGEDEDEPVDPKLLARKSTTASQFKKSKDGEDGFSDRKRVFGRNILPEKKTKNVLQLAWIALHDKILIVLSVACVVSLALGIYTSITKSASEGARIDWVEGVAILVAVLVVIFVGAGNDWQKEQQFKKLTRKKDDRIVLVRRSGKTLKLSVYDIYPGDVMVLETGDVIPVDGIFIDGHNVNCDESSATGESDIIKKMPATQVLKALDEGQLQQGGKRLDPFILSGAKVSEGFGTFLVTAVGENSEHGKTMMALRDENEVTPLQYKLNRLAGKFGYTRLFSALIYHRPNRQTW
jgi:Ca2+-transporting ATPase